MKKRLKIKIDRVRPARILKDRKNGFYYIKDGNKKIPLKDRNGHLLSNVNRNTVSIVNKIVSERVKKRRRKRVQDASKRVQDAQTNKSLNNPFRSNIPFSMYFPGFANAQIRDNNQLLDILRRLEVKNKLAYDPKYGNKPIVNIINNNKKEEGVVKQGHVKQGLVKQEVVKQEVVKQEVEPDFIQKKKEIDQIYKKLNEIRKRPEPVRERTKIKRAEEITEKELRIADLIQGEEKLDTYVREKYGFIQSEREVVPRLALHDRVERAPLIEDEEVKVVKTPRREEFAPRREEVSSLAQVGRTDVSGTRQDVSGTREDKKKDFSVDYRNKLIKTLKTNKINYDERYSNLELEDLLRLNGKDVPSYFGNGIESGLNKPLYDDQIYGLLAPYKDFVGCIMRDEIDTLLDDMLLKKKDKFGFVINTDTSKGKGKHWQSIYVDNDDKKEIDFYDSYGDEPSSDVKKALKQYASHFPYMLKMKVNKIGHQAYTSNLCGWHASSFLERMFKGSNFIDATDYNHSIPEEIQRMKEMKYKKFGYI